LKRKEGKISEFFEDRKKSLTKKRKPSGYWSKKQLRLEYIDLRIKLGREPRSIDFQKNNSSAYIALLRSYNNYNSFLKANNFNLQITLPEHLRSRSRPKTTSIQELLALRKQGYSISFQVTNWRKAPTQLFYVTLNRRLNRELKSSYGGWISRKLMLKIIPEEKIINLERSNKKTSIGVSHIIDKLDSDLCAS